MSQTDFVNAKNGLLKYYTDSQTSLATRFFAFVTAIFAMTVALGSNLLFNSFNVSFFHGSEAFSAKLLVFVVGSFVLLIYAVRTVFRYAVFAGLCNRVLVVRLEELDGKNSIHDEIHWNAIERLKPYKLFIWFKAQYFIEDARQKEDIRKGWVISFLIALVLIHPLVFLVL